MDRREWGAAALMTAGLAGVLIFFDPRPGKGSASGTAWLIGGVVSVAVIAMLVAIGRARSRDVRAALLGAATGVTFGLTAALMKEATTALDRGVVSLLGSWTTYALIASGVAGMFLMQNANASRPPGRR